MYQCNNHFYPIDQSYSFIFTFICLSNRSLSVIHTYSHSHTIDHSQLFIHTHILIQSINLSYSYIYIFTFSSNRSLSVIHTYSHSHPIDHSQSLIPVHVSSSHSIIRIMHMSRETDGEQINTQ